MGFRKMIKSLFPGKPLGNHGPQPLFPSTPTRTMSNLYQHPNGPIQPVKSRSRLAPAAIMEPLECHYKSYTMASGLVVPPEFSYDHPKKIYEVSGLQPTHDWRRHLELDDDVSEESYTKTEGDEVFDGDDEAEHVGHRYYHDDDASSATDLFLNELSRLTDLTLSAHAGANSTQVSPRPLPNVPGHRRDDYSANMASDFFFNTLTRMTELALTAHEPDNDPSLRQVSPRPLPDILEANTINSPPARRGIRVLSGVAMRKVRGIRISSGGTKRSRIVRVISGDQASSGDEAPRPVPR